MNLQLPCNDTVQHCNLAPQYFWRVAGSLPQFCRFVAESLPERCRTTSLQCSRNIAKIHTRNIAKADIGLNLQRLCNVMGQHCNLAPQYCRDVAAMLWCCVGGGGVERGEFISNGVFWGKWFHFCFDEGWFVELGEWMLGKVDAKVERGELFQLGSLEGIKVVSLLVKLVR